MNKHFTHLHLHTEFSLLDGAITLDKLINYGKANNFKAMGISDHGNIFGAVKFFQKAQAAGIKPILGMEAYLTEDVRIKKADNKYYHLLIIVQNQVGYKNLCKLISYSFQKGFYFKPRIDYAMLAAHSEGLIVTTSCLGGHIPQLMLAERFAEAQTHMDWFLKTFGPERFYCEVQPADQKDQILLNNHLYEWSEKKGVPLLATCDSHYVSPDDHYAHEVMLCIGTHDKIDNPQRYTFGECRVHMRNQTQMLELFNHHEQAVWNSGAIADQCTFEFEMGKLFFPKFAIPQSHTPESYFTKLCHDGLTALINSGRITQEGIKEYQDRLNLEIDLIISMGFIGYFLVVSDFIQWARSNAIPVGPGRGSAAGSLVSWALQITNIDPLKYNLLFERFLNPERITMPDIDIDFCIEGRETVISYVREKYGHDKVCQIITFGSMLAKGVIKDVARVLGLPFEDSNAITNLIPEQLKITLDEAIEQEPRLKELIDSNPKVKKIFDLALRLEGLTRHASKHAAGIVISPEAIDEVLPIYIPSKSTELVTQYAMTELEALGFLKIDFLGLKNLTVIDRTLALIKKNHAVSLNIDMLPLDDPKTFQLLCAGHTSGVFQLESSGLKEVLRKLQPEKFEDIIAVNALYRPGPLGSGMVEDFIERKHGRQKISYLFEELTPILEETYGVIVYQEQVMKIAAIIGGYSLGEADILRRAMGKKKADVMQEQRKIFLEKSSHKGFDSKKTGELFDLMAYFAGYGFNKSHSAAYAMIAYQTAYLKANYAPEFMTSILTLESNNAEKLAFYLAESHDRGLEILPPDINQSDIDFNATSAGKIRFGLQGIKNVGLASLENIIEQRKKGPFKDLLDFCTRIDLRTSNKRVLENLIFAGAFDTLPGNRAQKFNELNRIIDRAIEKKHALETGQMGLFGMIHTQSEKTALYAYEAASDWPTKQKLEKEKEVIGFYLSAHPLDSYKQFYTMLNIPQFATIAQQRNDTSLREEPIVIGCGLITSKRIITTKKGDRMAFVQLEDKESKAEIILFPRVFKAAEQWIDEHQIFLVKGTLDVTSTTCKIKANNFIPLDLFFQEWKKIEHIFLHIPTPITQPLIDTIDKTLPKGTTPLIFVFQENGKKLLIHSKKRVTMTQEAIATLGKNNVSIQVKI
ncbi:MAG: DNA polymerase III subunit alpha [Candidatus Babeliales bacterium]